MNMLRVFFGGGMKKVFLLLVFYCLDMHYSNNKVGINNFSEFSSVKLYKRDNK